MDRILEDVNLEYDNKMIKYIINIKLLKFFKITIKTQNRKFSL